MAVKGHGRLEHQADAAARASLPPRRAFRDFSRRPRGLAQVGVLQARPGVLHVLSLALPLQSRRTGAAPSPDHDAAARACARDRHDVCRHHGGPGARRPGVGARCAREAGRANVHTTDPSATERCPPLIAAFPPELRDRISFFPQSSAMYFDEAIARSRTYDLVLIDGSHELEFAGFDLDCTARLMRPGGIVVLDNIEQVGPRFATKLFLERHPDWIGFRRGLRMTAASARAVR